MLGLGEGGAGGANDQEGEVELAGFEGLAGGVLLVERDVGSDLADEAAAVYDLAGGEVDALGYRRNGEASEEGAVAVVSEAGEDALPRSEAYGVEFSAAMTPRRKRQARVVAVPGGWKRISAGADASRNEGGDAEGSVGPRGSQSVSSSCWDEAVPAWPVRRTLVQSSSRGGRPEVTARPVTGCSAWRTRRRLAWSGPVFWIQKGIGQADGRFDLSLLDGGEKGRLAPRTGGGGGFPARPEDEPAG